MSNDGDFSNDAAFPWSIIGIALLILFWWGVKDDPFDGDILPRMGIAGIAYYWLNRIFEAIGHDGVIMTSTPIVLAVSLFFVLGLAKWSRKS